METRESDVLIIGSGLAGLRAAIESATNGAVTTVLAKSSLAASNSALGGGGMQAPEGEEAAARFVSTVLDIGRGLNDRDLVAAVAREAAHESRLAQEWGVPLVRTPPFSCWVDGSKVPPKTHGGRLLLNGLMRQAKEDERITFLPHFFVDRLAVEEGRITGVTGFDKEGRSVSITARSVVLAAGGGGAIYRRNDNQKRSFGDGYALALEAGLGLLDMEFVQFYPFGFSEPGVPPALLYPPYPKQARVIDRAGADFFRKHGIDAPIEKVAQELRDKASAVLYVASEEGDALMDYTGVPDEDWGRNPLTLLPASRFDFRTKPFHIAPIAHFFMGGVRTGSTGRTGIEGLFAAGEVAGGLHGANRMGGNAFSECLVFGAATGRAAALFAREKGPYKSSAVRPKTGTAPRATGKAPGTSLRLADALKALRAIAWGAAGPLRSEDRMKEALSDLAGWEERLGHVEARDVPSLISRKELLNGFLVLKTVLTASILRKESRGALQREDYPDEGGPDFLKRVSVRMKGGERQIEAAWEK